MDGNDPKIAGSSGYCAYLERLTLSALDAFPTFVAPNVHFKDPFNEVHGIEHMRTVFEDMFTHVADLRFDIHHRLSDGDVTLIEWTLGGRLMGRVWQVDGASRLRFASDGKLIEHIDYWDAASGLYERFPVVGGILRILRRKLSAAPGTRQ